MTDLQKTTIRAMVNIFESGRIHGDYGAIAVMKGDKGHLSYGRSQTTLGGGGLYTLLDRYCQAPGAQFADALRPALSRFKAKDFTLDNDTNVKSILKKAGADPVMQAMQDQFFNENFFVPACHAAEVAGVQTPLGQALVYDSHIQGGWGIIKPKVPSLQAAGGESSWVEKYIAARKSWLLTCKSPLPATVYRMDTFRSLSTSGNWDLKLPLEVHGLTLREDILMGDGSPASPVKRKLVLTNPWMRGEDVVKLEQKLKEVGFPNKCEGVYGPFTDALVKKFQASKGIKEAGIGPLTIQALGL